MDLFRVSCGFIGVYEVSLGFMGFLEGFEVSSGVF